MRHIYYTTFVHFPETSDTIPSLAMLRIALKCHSEGVSRPKNLIKGKRLRSFLASLVRMTVKSSASQWMNRFFNFSFLPKHIPKRPKRGSLPQSKAAYGRVHQYLYQRPSASRNRFNADITVFLQYPQRVIQRGSIGKPSPHLSPQRGLAKLASHLPDAPQQVFGVAASPVAAGEHVLRVGGKAPCFILDCYVGCASSQ